MDNFFLLLEYLFPYLIRLQGIRSMKEEGARMALELHEIQNIRIKLLRYCIALTGSLWDAEDLAQDTCVKAMAVLQGERRHDNPLAYVLRIAKTTWIDRKRSKLSMERLGESADQEHAVLDPEPFELDSGLRILARYLSPLQRTVLLLRDVLGYSTEQSARSLETTEGAVKAALRRARQTLRKLQLTENDIDDMDQLRASEAEWVEACSEAIRVGDSVWVVQLFWREVEGSTVEAVGMFLPGVPSMQRSSIPYSSNRAQCLAA